MGILIFPAFYADFMPSIDSLHRHLTVAIVDSPMKYVCN